MDQTVIEHSRELILERYNWFIVSELFGILHIGELKNNTRDAEKKANDLVSNLSSSSVDISSILKESQEKSLKFNKKLEDLINEIKTIQDPRAMIHKRTLEVWIELQSQRLIERNKKLESEKYNIGLSEIISKSAKKLEIEIEQLNILNDYLSVAHWK